MPIKKQTKGKLKPHRAWVCPEVRTVIHQRELDLIKEKLPYHFSRLHPEYNVAQLDASIAMIPWGRFIGKTIANIAIEQGESVGSREHKDVWAWWMLLILFPNLYKPDYGAK